MRGKKRMSAPVKNDHLKEEMIILGIRNDLYVIIDLNHQRSIEAGVDPKKDIMRIIKRDTMATGIVNGTRKTEGKDHDHEKKKVEEGGLDQKKRKLGKGDLDLERTKAMEEGQELERNQDNKTFDDPFHQRGENQTLQSIPAVQRRRKEIIPSFLKAEPKNIHLNVNIFLELIDILLTILRGINHRKFQLIHHTQQHLIEGDTLLNHRKSLENQKIEKGVAVCGVQGVNHLYWKIETLHRR